MIGASQVVRRGGVHVLRVAGLALFREALRDAKTLRALKEVQNHVDEGSKVVDVRSAAALLWACLTMQCVVLFSGLHRSQRLSPVGALLARRSLEKVLPIKATTLFSVECADWCNFVACSGLRVLLLYL